MDNYKIGKITLSDDQQELLDKIGLWLDDKYTTKNYNHSTHKNRLFVYTGPAGSGKTTVVEAIVDYYDLQGRFVILSPTWKAANNMKKIFPASKRDCMTIHRFAYKPLEGLENGDVLRFEEKSMNDRGIEIIFVEESSMVTKETIDYLLTSGLRVVMFGDIRQLPPINSDFCCYFKNYDCELLESHRQDGKSDILRFANDIYNRRVSIDGLRNYRDVQQKIAELKSIYTKGDVIFVDEYNFFRWIRDEGWLPDIALCYNNDTKIDLTNNIRLRRNKDGLLSTIDGFDVVTPCVGDIIMCCKTPEFTLIDDCGIERRIYTSYEGTITHIYEINLDEDLIVFDFKCDNEDGTIFKEVSAYLTTFYYPSPNSIVRNEEDRVRFTFALGNTIHKSQGSEYNVVAFLSSFRTIDIEATPSNNLFYVAATRAKKQLIVVLCYLKPYWKNYSEAYGWLKLPEFNSHLPEAIRKSNRTNLIK